MAMRLTPSHRSGLRFLVLFAGIFSLLQLALIECEGTALERLLLDRATVDVAAHAIGWILPQDDVSADGTSIVSSRLRLNVLRGCEGTEVMFLLIAAVVAYPSPWSARLQAAAIGCLFAYAANQVRILALYLTVRNAPEHFGLMHGYIAPTAMIVLMLVFFLLWTARQALRSPTALSRDARRHP